MIQYIINLLPILLRALIVTITIEIIFLFFQREKGIKIYLTCFIMNIFTNITMNILLQYFSNNYYNLLIIFEILVFLIEGFIYAFIKKSIPKGLRISFISNVASLIIGILIL